MQTVLEQGSIDKPLTFDVGLIQLSFIPVCSLNTCNISVKLCRGFAALQCFSLVEVLLSVRVEFAGSKIAITTANFGGLKKKLYPIAALKLGFMMICAISPYSIPVKS